MIGPKDILDSDGYYICFHCGKKDMKRDKVYCICFGEVGTNDRFQYYGSFNDKEGTFKRAVFCVDCWKEIAGEEYMFTE